MALSFRAIFVPILAGVLRSWPRRLLAKLAGYSLFGEAVFVGSQYASGGDSNHSIDLADPLFSGNLLDHLIYETFNSVFLVSAEHGVGLFVDSIEAVNVLECVGRPNAGNVTRYVLKGLRKQRDNLSVGNLNGVHAAVPVQHESKH